MRQKALSPRRPSSRRRSAGAGEACLWSATWQHFWQHCGPSTAQRCSASAACAVTPVAPTARSASSSPGRAVLAPVPWHSRPQRPSRSVASHWLPTIEIRPRYSGAHRPDVGDLRWKRHWRRWRRPTSSSRRLSGRSHIPVREPSSSSCRTRTPGSAAICVARVPSVTAKCRMQRGFGRAEPRTRRRCL